MRNGEKSTSACKDPAHRKMFSTLTTTICLLAVTVMSLLIYLNGTLGWFSENKRTGANGMTLDAEGKGLSVTLYDSSMNLIGDLSSGETINLDFDIPGDSKIYVLKVENISSSGSVVFKSIGFVEPTSSEEIPVIVTTGTPPSQVTSRYWFSTQLYLNSTNLGTTAPLANTVAHAFDSAPEGTVLSTASGTTGPGSFVLLTGNTTLAENESVYIAFKVLFKNLDSDQNVYRNFGRGTTDQNPAPCCMRRVYVTFE